MHRSCETTSSLHVSGEALPVVAGALGVGAVCRLVQRAEGIACEIALGATRLPTHRPHRFKFVQQIGAAASDACRRGARRVPAPQGIFTGRVNTQSLSFIGA